MHFFFMNIKSTKIPNWNAHCCISNRAGSSDVIAAGTIYHSTRSGYHSDESVPNVEPQVDPDCASHCGYQRSWCNTGCYNCLGNRWCDFDEFLWCIDDCDYVFQNCIGFCES
jgi:hypothetical protein